MNSRFVIAGARGVLEFRYGHCSRGGYSPLLEPSQPGVSWILSRIFDADLRFFRFALSSAASLSARCKFGFGGPCFEFPVSLPSDFALIGRFRPSIAVCCTINWSRQWHLCLPYSGPQFSVRRALAPCAGLWQCPRASGALSAASHGRCGLVVLKAAVQSCRSSVVEHSLGKGEVESSIPSGSTRIFQFRSIL